MQAAILGYVGSWRHARSKTSTGGGEDHHSLSVWSQTYDWWRSRHPGCWDVDVLMGGEIMVWVKERQWRRLAVKPTWFSSERLGQSHSLARNRSKLLQNLRKSPFSYPIYPIYSIYLQPAFFPVSPRYSTVTSSTFLVYALALFHNSGADLLSTLILFQTRESQKDQWVGDPYCTPYTCRGWSWGAAPRILRCSILTIYYGVYGVLRILLLFTIMVQPSTCLASTYLDIQVSLE